LYLQHLKGALQQILKDMHLNLPRLQSSLAINACKIQAM